MLIFGSIKPLESRESLLRAARHESCFVPVDRFAQPVFEGSLRAKSKPLPCACRVELTSRLSVRLICLPANRAFKSGEARNLPDQILDNNFTAVAEVYRVRPIIGASGSYNSLSAVFDVQEFSRRLSRSPYFDKMVASVPRLHTFTNQSWDHMRCFQIKIVARSVKVRRQKKDRVEAILLTIGLRLHEHHFFGQTVRSVCFFRIAVPDIVFFERHRREFRIGAHGSGGDEFFHAM